MVVAVVAQVTVQNFRNAQFLRQPDQQEDFIHPFMGLGEFIDHTVEYTTNSFFGFSFFMKG